MFKRILFLIIFIFPLVTNADLFSKGLLWEISSQSGKQSYLLGTMHSDDERITQLPVAIRSALNHSDSFSGEVMMDMATITSMSKMMYFTDGRQLKDIIGEERYQKSTEYLLQYGVPDFMVAIMKPWAVATTLSLPKPKTGKFLDLMLFQDAMSQGKAVYGLESAHEQMSVLDGMPEDQQIVMLDEAIENFHRIPEIFQRFVTVYLNRDLKGLQNLNKELMAGSDQKVAEHFEKKLLVKRNYRMVDRMQPRLKEGKAFIAVGALHLPGDEGVLNLLVDKGYVVKAIY